MKKKKIIIVIMVALLILLLPIPFKLKDGGTVEWKSLIYKISKVHKLNIDSETGYEDGMIVEILGFKVYDNVNFNKIADAENDNMKATIKAVVVKVNENNLLAMGIENKMELYSIGLKTAQNIKFEKGQEILVYFNGTVMESYPAQIGNIERIETIKEKSNTQIPDDIMRFCYNSKDKVNVVITELTNSGITLTITDTNDLQYNYSHSYRINKKVKNKNYIDKGEKIGEDTQNSTSGFTRNRLRICVARGR